METDDSPMDRPGTTSSFSRAPLQDVGKQIRLLRIHPSAEGDEIRCSLSVHNLGEVNNQYIAISYAWGEPGRERAIHVNGAAFLVRYNCWYALWQMRNRYHSKKRDWHALWEMINNYFSKRYYWIDSICINQCDHEEKTKQIPIMSEIYSQAKSVAACIGELDDTFLEILSRYPVRREDYFRSVELGQQLQTREYFQRFWVVQERAHDKRISVFCGPKIWRPTDDDSFLSSQMRQRSGDSSQIGFDYAVSVFSQLACSDLHDQVYALLALAHPGEREAIIPDYHQPLWSLLVDFSVAVWNNTSPPRLQHWPSVVEILSDRFSSDLIFVENAR